MLSESHSCIAADGTHIAYVALGGGCFFNRVMTERLVEQLKQRGLQAWLPQTVSCGDAGLALGQAWVAQQQLRATTGDRH